jgi:FkbM family methyltransferase
MTTHALEAREYRTPKGRTVSMLQRVGTSDHNTLYSALDEDEYGLAQHNLTGRAADVGAHIGSVSVGLLVDNPNLLVVAVEPVPPNVELLRQNLERNGVLDRCEIIQAAVGSGRTTTIRFGYVGDGTDAGISAEHHSFIGNSALVYPKQPMAFEHSEVKVPVRSLKFLLPLDFLKVDTEGGEWGFLASPSVAEVPYIVGEVHPTNGHAPLHMAALLQDTHNVTFTGPPGGPCGFVAVRRTVTCGKCGAEIAFKGGQASHECAA